MPFSVLKKLSAALATSSGGIARKHSIVEHDLLSHGAHAVCLYMTDAPGEIARGSKRFKYPGPNIATRGTFRMAAMCMAAVSLHI